MSFPEAYRLPIPHCDIRSLAQSLFAIAFTLFVVSIPSVRSSIHAIGGSIVVEVAAYGAQGSFCDATPDVRSNCDGRSSCSFDVSNSMCGDPIHGVYKDIFVKYHCTGNPQVILAVECEEHFQCAQVRCNVGIPAGMGWCNLRKDSESSVGCASFPNPCLREIGSQCVCHDPEANPECEAGTLITNPKHDLPMLVGISVGVTVSVFVLVGLVTSIVVCVVCRRKKKGKEQAAAPSIAVVVDSGEIRPPAEKEEDRQVGEKDDREAVHQAVSYNSKMTQIEQIVGETSRGAVNDGSEWKGVWTPALEFIDDLLNHDCDEERTSTSDSDSERTSTTDADSERTSASETESWSEAEEFGG